jgi:hypothetical protein
VQPIIFAEAEPLILLYGWFGTVPAVNRAAVVCGDEYGESLGIWDRWPDPLWQVNYTGKEFSCSRSGGSPHIVLSQ